MESQIDHVPYYVLLPFVRILSVVLTEKIWTDTSQFACINHFTTEFFY